MGANAPCYPVGKIGTVDNDENVVPELLQQDCTPERLASALSEVLSDAPLRRRQLEAFAGIDAIMSTGNQPPGVRAADIVLAALRKSRRPA